MSNMYTTTETGFITTVNTTEIPLGGNIKLKTIVSYATYGVIAMLGIFVLAYLYVFMQRFNVDKSSRIRHRFKYAAVPWMKENNSMKRECGKGLPGSEADVTSLSTKITQSGKEITTSSEMTRKTKTKEKCLSEQDSKQEHQEIQIHQCKACIS